jgi:hypothetical protein
MPRLPLHPTLLCRLTQSPARFSLRAAYIPLITAYGIRQTKLFSSSTPRSISVLPPRQPKRVWPYLYKDFDTMPHLEPYFKQVDSLQDHFIERLRDAVAIPSISSEDARRPDVVKVRDAGKTRHEQPLTAVDGPLARRPNQGPWWNRRAP